MHRQGTWGAEKARKQPQTENTGLKNDQSNAAWIFFQSTEAKQGVLIIFKVLIRR